MVVPKVLGKGVIGASHGKVGSGHTRVRKCFYWGRGRRDVEDFCRRCDARTARNGPPIAPLSNGLVERLNGTVAEQLAIVTETNQQDWDRHLPFISMACRSAVQDSTSCTPALLMLGRKIRTPGEMAYGRPPDAPAVPLGPEYASRLQASLETAYSFARQQLLKEGTRQKRN